MNKLIEKIKSGSSKMNKQLVATVIVTFIIAGILGFYTGRIYEQRMGRNRFPITGIGSQGGVPNQWKGGEQHGGSRSNTKVQD